MLEKTGISYEKLIDKSSELGDTQGGVLDAFKDLDNELVSIRDFFKDKPANKVYVFGSYARGDADENSDIDLLIDWDYNQHIGLNYYSWVMDFKAIMKKETDFVSLEFLSPLIEKYVNRDKILVYER